MSKICWNCGEVMKWNKSRDTATCTKCGATDCPHAEGIEPRYSWLEEHIIYFCTNLFCNQRETR
jgi:anaerobic ribonucleoside-triphosphate reductase